MTSNQQHYALLRMGVNVPPHHKQQLLKSLKANSSLFKQFQTFKTTIKTMIDQDQFLDVITASHNKIADIAQNFKVINKRQSTYIIRAINPDHILSLTERAFFNSYNLDRNVLNDLQQQNVRKQAPDYQREEIQNKQSQQRHDKPDKQPRRIQFQQQDKCICGRVLPQTHWIQCSNESKCRGSSWYHLQCAGIKLKPEQIQNIQFICQSCRRPTEERQSNGESQSKRFKSNEQ